jgi:DNA-binding HxlR family transcriptional regulator
MYRPALPRPHQHGKNAGENCMMIKMARKSLGNTKNPETRCPVALANIVVGDRWTVIVIRELFLGSRRFEEIQAQTEATPQMLATRLKRLETDGFIERRPYSDRPIRYEYWLTEKGLAFYPVLMALRAWGETWCKAEDESLAIQYTHRPCGQEPGLGPTCRSCGAVLEREDLVAKLSDAYEAERLLRQEAFKSG